MHIIFQLNIFCSWKYTFLCSQGTFKCFQANYQWCPIFNFTVQSSCFALFWWWNLQSWHLMSQTVDGIYQAFILLNNNLLFIWSIWVSGNWWIIENIIWMQISSVSEAGRAKVNDCIISKLINTDNKTSTKCWRTLFLSFFCGFSVISPSPDKVHGLDLEQCCNETSKKFVLCRFSVVKQL